MLRRRWLESRPSVFWIHAHAHLERDLLVLDAEAADGLVTCGVEGVGLDDLVVEPLREWSADARWEYEESMRGVSEGFHLLVFCKSARISAWSSVSPCGFVLRARSLGVGDADCV